MFKVSAAFLGILIAVMVSLNGVLASYIGNSLTLPMIYCSGLIGTLFVLIFIREASGNKKVPFYLNTGGLVGVLLIMMNNISFSALGASLTIALGVLGQTAASLVADSTGFLGMKKYYFDKRKISGFILLILGVLVMTESWSGELLYIFYAFTAGIFVILSMVLNSQLSIRIGTFHSTLRNYMTGLVLALIILVIMGFPGRESIRHLTSINPLFLFGGGLLGVFIVAGSNKILPRIPVVYTTLLLFSGQVGAGIIIDFVVSGDFSLRKLTGAFIIFSGLFLNMMIDKKAKVSLLGASNL